MSDTAHDSHPGFEANQPVFEVVEGGNNLMPVMEIDLRPIQFNAMMKGEKFNPHDATRFLLEAADGPYEDEVFDKYYGQALGAINEAVLAEKRGDDIVNQNLRSSLMDVALELEELKPRLMKLLDRVRDERVLDPESSVMLNKISMLFAIQTCEPSTDS